MSENNKNEWRYDFGRVPKGMIGKCWRCDVFTGELKKVEVNKEQKWEKMPKGTTGKLSTNKQLVNVYWVMTKPNYFFLFANTIEEAKEQFEKNFEEAERQINAKQKHEEECQEKV